MAIYLVTYDLKAPGRNYQPVYGYLKRFTYCKGMESVWLIQTARSASEIRDELMKQIDTNDVIFITRIMQDWGSYRYTCSTWLNEVGRSW